MPPNRSHTSLDYRPDIDGLRAIAVLAVVLYHVSPALIPGGFAGVDIFFVISGFLISGIILKELQQGSFSFAGFYARRVIRIFPALILVLAASGMFGFFALLPGEFHALMKHIAGGAAFVSNFILWREVSYFDTAAHLKPLLHLWSLSIEEQFYIGWPLLLVLITKRTRRVMLTIGIVLTVSFLANVILVKRFPSFTFYSAITRMWELLIGAALARFSLSSGRFRSPEPSVSHSLSLLGGLLIAAAFFFLKDGKQFPGWWALLPTAGAALVIGAGPRGWINRWVLSSPVCVLVGLISYPLYLWHWPVLVFSQLLIKSDFPVPADQLTLFRLGAAAFSGFLAWGTWRFLEMPVRHFERIPRSGKAYRLAAVMTVMALFGLLASNRFIQPRLSTPSTLAIARATVDWDYNSQDNYMTPKFVLHEIRSPSKQVVLFVGDSHIEQYWPAVTAAIRKTPSAASAAFATSGGCIPLPGLNESGFYCPQFNNWWSTQADAANVSTVVIGADWESYFSGAYSEQAAAPLLNVNGGSASPLEIEKAWTDFEATVGRLVHSGKRVFLLASHPTSPTFDPHIVFHRFRNLEPSKLQPLDKAAFNRFIAPIQDRLLLISNRTGAILIRPVEVFCDRDFCPATDRAGTPLYKDTNHLRPFAVIRRAGFLADILTVP